jgi:hypothetical protein
VIQIESHISRLRRKGSKVQASALQSFENSIFLIGLGRFPAALTACATAVESTIRAIRGYKATSPDDGLKATMDFAIQRKPRLNMPNLLQFRTARNEFIHHGYSPEDDERAVSLLFGVGYPFLSLCLWEFHCFSTRSSVINGFWEQVEIAEKVTKEIGTSIRTAPNGTKPQQVSGARALQHAVWISFRNPLHARWTDIDYGLPDHEYAARERAKKLVEGRWTFHTYMNCPIPTCASFECCVALDGESTAKLAPVALLCFDCGFRLGEGDTILMKHLVGVALDKSRSKILSEYGLDI